MSKKAKLAACAASPVGASAEPAVWSGSRGDISFATVSLPGRSREDRAVNNLSHPPPTEGAGVDCASFGVFDGHLGSFTSDLAARQLHSRCMSRFHTYTHRWETMTSRSLSPELALHAEKLGRQGIRDALFLRAYNDALASVHAEAASAGISGSTSLSMFLFPITIPSSVSAFNENEPVVIPPVVGDEADASCRLEAGVPQTKPQEVCIGYRLITANVGDSRGLAVFTSADYGKGSTPPTSSLTDSLVSTVVVDSDSLSGQSADVSVKFTTPNTPSTSEKFSRPTHPSRLTTTDSFLDLVSPQSPFSSPSEDEQIISMFPIGSPMSPVPPKPPCDPTGSSSSKKNDGDLKTPRTIRTLLTPLSEDHSATNPREQTRILEKRRMNIQTLPYDIALQSRFCRELSSHVPTTSAVNFSSDISSSFSPDDKAPGVNVSRSLLRSRLEQRHSMELLTDSQSRTTVDLSSKIIPPPSPSVSLNGAAWRGLAQQHSLTKPPSHFTLSPAGDGTQLLLPSSGCLLTSGITSVDTIVDPDALCEFSDALDSAQALQSSFAGTSFTSLMREDSGDDVIHARYLESFFSPRVGGGEIGPLAYYSRSGSSILMARSVGDRGGPRGCIPLPEFTALSIPLNTPVRLILATDGLWDVVENHTVRRMAAYFRFDTPAKLATALAIKGRRRRERKKMRIDDICVTVVDICPDNSLFVSEWNNIAHTPYRAVEGVDAKRRVLARSDSKMKSLCDLGSANCGNPKIDCRLLTEISPPPTNGWSCLQS